MLTRLQIKGFKNLADLTVRFGPFTCFAGPNAAGKSNLFDAIRFLHLLSQKPIMEAVGALRDMRGRAPSASELFTNYGSHRETEMRFAVDLVVRREVEDEFGAKGKAAISTLRYEIAFRLSESDPGILELAYESLVPLPLREARQTLGFEHTPEFRNSIVDGRRVGPFVTTKNHIIHVHQEGHGGRELPAPKSSVTIVNGMGHADFPSILAIKQEMASWQTLTLEPSAMRSPSSYRDSREIDSRGANLPNAVRRLMAKEKRPGQIGAQIANRLSQLIEDVKDVRIEEDDRFESRTLAICGRDGAFHPAHSLSDSTLRFMVLTVLELDRQVGGLICLEEPENGIHPERIEAIMQLLRDISVDPMEPVDSESNPLRQVVINTHSPQVVRNVRINDLVYLGNEQVISNGDTGLVAAAYVPGESWRAEDSDRAARLVPGQILSYLGRGETNSDGQLVFDWAERKLG